MFVVGRPGDFKRYNGILNGPSLSESFDQGGCLLSGSDLKWHISGDMSGEKREIGITELATPAKPSNRISSLNFDL